MSTGEEIFSSLSLSSINSSNILRISVDSAHLFLVERSDFNFLMTWPVKKFINFSTSTGFSMRRGQTAKEAILPRAYAQHTD